MKLTKNFSKSEFDCSCGCKMPLGVLHNVQKLANQLQELRNVVGSPIKINSGYRCENHPESIKNPKSSHIKGLAVDIKCTDSKKRAIIIDALGYVGFKRFGIADTFIHTDIDNKKSNPVIWLY